MNDENPKYNSVDMARYLVAYANEHGFTINMTKLQKLLYIAYGTYLAPKNRRLINEHPQAWPYGPVFQTTRDKLLKKNLSGIRSSDQGLETIKNDNEVQALLKLVFDSFGSKTATTLTVWSHQSGSPWDRVSSQEGFTWGEIIPDKYIQEYFNSILIRNGGN